MPVSRPRRFFGFFLIAEKETRPQAKSHCTQFFDPTRRADEDIRPYGGVETCAGDRKGHPYGVEWQYAVNGGPIWDRPLRKEIRAISYYS